MKVFPAFFGFVGGVLGILLVRPLMPEDPLLRVVPLLVVVLLLGVGVGPALAAAFAPAVGIQDSEDEEEDWDEWGDETDFVSTTDES
ncbi:MAG: hypothetical protein AAB855_00725 [Patescibacteria group bacterium]